MSEALLLKIVDQLNHLQNDVSGLKSDFTDLKSDVAGLKSDFTDQKSDVAGLKSDIKSLKTDMDYVKNAVSEIPLIKQAVLETNEIVHHLKTEDQQLNLRVSALETDVKLLKSIVTNQ